MSLHELRQKLFEERVNNAANLHQVLHIKVRQILAEIGGICGVQCYRALEFTEHSALEFSVCNLNNLKLSMFPRESHEGSCLIFKLESWIFG